MLEATKKYLDDFGKEVVRLAQRNLNLAGFAGQKRNRKKNASGELSDSLGYEFKPTNTGLTMQFTSTKSYAPFVEEGRKKGKFVPIRPLINWILKKKSMRLFVIRKPFGQKVAKPVQKNEKNAKSAAIAMSKEIKKRGIKPAPFFGDALDEAFDKMGDELQDALVVDLEDLLFQDFQKQPNVTIK